MDKETKERLREIRAALKKYLNQSKMTNQRIIYYWKMMFL